MGQLSFNKKNNNERSEKLRKDIDFVEHTWTTEKLQDYYKMHLDNGLTEQQVEENREKFGENKLTPPKVLPWYIKFLLQFTNFFALLLIGGGLLCFIAYAIDSSDPANLYLGIVLILVVLITATFSYLQESSSEKLMEGFKNMIPRKCKVVRGGAVQVVDAVTLVPGDLVNLEDGQQVPADIRVMESNELKVDNSSLTGESEPVDRSNELLKDSNGNLITQPLEANNLVFYTTIVSSGSGKGVVIGTGDRTVMGQIAGLTTETTTEQSPIAKEIAKFILLISFVAVTLGITFFIIGAVLGTDLVSNFVFCIGIIVANVPEGLLATVTVSLALTAKRMHQKNVLVKHLEAVETLGSTTVIASDKTGTLTQNRMTVQHCWCDGQTFRCPTARNKPHLDLIQKAASKEPLVDFDNVTFKQLSMVATICNNSQFVTKDPLDPESPIINVQESVQKPDFNLLNLSTTGDASESGLIKFVQMVRDIEDYRSAMPKLFEIKFNSTNKWQLSIHKPEPGCGVNSPVLVLKGAPERVLKMCKKILIDGKEVDLNADWEQKYTTAYESLGGLGERVLGFAYKNMNGFSMDHKFVSKPEPNFPLDDLTFVGLFSLIDPPKDGVPEAVAKCKRARIKVYMVTGDHPITAQAIAKQVGIIDQDKWDAGKAAVVRGDDIREWMELDVDQRNLKFDQALSYEQLVFARVSPAHKLLIVENAQRRGEVVAVTGDGVNDAPALKKGDIGIAMGIAGKDVSKEAADMILMDDNFASIVNGVEEGRLVFDNLKKSISYTLTSNIPEIAPFLTYITLQLPLPLSTVLILCVDLGTDMVPAISLAHELKEADIMDRPPRNSQTDRLVNRRLIAFAYLQIGIIQALAGFFTYFVVLNDYGYAPRVLRGTGFQWDQGHQVICELNDDLRTRHCGFGCSSPYKEVENSNGEKQKSLFGTYADEFGDGNGWCEGGCQTPFPGFTDPFIEFTDQGFRGFVREYTDNNQAVSISKDNSIENVCGRSCIWFDNLVRNEPDLFAKMKASRGNESEPLRLMMTVDDEYYFNYYCYDAPGVNLDYNTVALRTDQDNVFKTYGFPQRKQADKKQTNARTGAFYWWNGNRQIYPNAKYQKEALFFAQSAYLSSIVVVQWADLLISKTRKLSAFQQGLKNGWMNFGLVFETVLIIILSYVPFLNTGLGTRPLHILHWFTGFPFSMMIFLYDEIRKYIMRQNPGGWLDRFTYW